MRVLDIGSRVAQPGFRSYRTALLDLPGIEYSGLDVEAGENVDIVASDPYRFPVEPESYDVAISGSVFEHIEFPWLTIQEMAKALRPGGYAVVIAPSSGPEHKYPVDCWRFYPDGMRALGKWAGLETVDVATGWHESKVFMFGDTVALYWKPKPDATTPALRIGNARDHDGASSPARDRYIDLGAWLLRLYKKIGRRFLTEIY